MKVEASLNLVCYRLKAQLLFSAARSSFRRVYSAYCRRVIKSVSEQVLILCQDLDIPRKDVDVILHRLQHNGITLVTQTLPSFGKNLEVSIAEGRFRAFTFFRTKHGSVLPDFLDSHLGRIFDCDGSLLPEPCPVSVYVVRQVCYFFQKLTNLPSHPSLDENVLKNFVATEKELEFFVFDREFSGYFRAAMARLLINFKSGSPRHGPGSCSNSASDIISKNSKELANIPSYWAAPVSHYYNAQDYWDNQARRSPQSSIFDLATLDSFGRDSTLNSAKVILVPKDGRGPRLISCEPVENQYIQQGIMRSLVDTIESDSIVGGQINFSSQQVNRDLAYRASFDQSFSTIDLKDASDRVHSSIMDLCPFEVEQAIRGCRSSYTLLPTGELLKLNKFAPMGSALCFPFLALLVYYSAVYGMVRFGGANPTFASKSVYVYGDDLIVPSDYFGSVVRALEMNGLKVNTLKSFHSSLFAESCGFDGFMGNDVTPLRCRSISPELVDAAEKDNAIVKYVELGNNLKSCGLHATAKYYYRAAELVVGRLPFKREGTPYVGKLARIWEISNRDLRYQKGRLCYRVKTITESKGESAYSWLRRKTPHRGWKDLFDPPKGELGTVDTRRISLKKSRISWKDYPF